MPLFNMIWQLDDEVVKLTDKQKLLYTILTRCDFLVTSMEHLYCRTSPTGTVCDGNQKPETGNVGGLGINLTNGSKLINLSGKKQQPVKEELRSATTSNDVRVPTTSLQLSSSRLMHHDERGLSRTAAITEKEQVVFGATKLSSQQQPTMSALNVTDKENDTVMQYRKRKIDAEELTAKGPVSISLFDDTSDNSSTVMATTKAKKLDDDCNMPLLSQQLPDPNGWVQFLSRRYKTDRHHCSIRQEEEYDQKSVEVKNEQGEVLSPADTKYVKLILLEEEGRVAIPNMVNGNNQTAATKYGLGRSSCFRKNIVPPPPLNPVSMEMLIEMAPTATDKVRYQYGSHS